MECIYMQWVLEGLSGKIIANGGTAREGCKWSGIFIISEVGLGLNKNIK